MSIQGVFNEGVTKQTSIWLSAAFVQITAFIVCVCAWFLTGHESNVSALFKIDNKYMLLGGVIGALITYTVIKSIDSLGPGQGILIIVTSQLLVAYLIELFGVLTKPFALMIRLFANMMAGHAIILSFASIIFISWQISVAIGSGMTILSFFMMLFMNCMEFLVAFIQAYVFTMLSSVFIGMAHPEHDSHKA